MRLIEALNQALAFGPPIPMSDRGDLRADVRGDRQRVEVEAGVDAVVHLDAELQREVWPATAVPLTNVEKNAQAVFAFSLFHSVSLVV